MIEDIIENELALALAKQNAFIAKKQKDEEIKFNLAKYNEKMLQEISLIIDQQLRHILKDKSYIAASRCYRNEDLLYEQWKVTCKGFETPKYISASLYHNRIGLHCNNQILICCDRKNTWEFYKLNKDIDNFAKHSCNGYLFDFKKAHYQKVTCHEAVEAIIADVINSMGTEYNIPYQKELPEYLSKFWRDSRYFEP